MNLSFCSEHSLISYLQAIHFRLIFAILSTCSVGFSPSSNFQHLFLFVTDDSFEEDDSADEDDDDKSRKNQNYFCFIDPTKILLQNVNREFQGNYSCRGYNAAGWGEVSEAKLLDIYYEPGNASVSVSPQIPLKGKSMVLSCSVEDAGNPKSTRFHWLRGEDPVKDIVTAEWTIDPVKLDSRNNFSCYSFNDGGNGTLATINIDVQVAPTFISKLPPYTGFLYSDTNITLSCRVECVPQCRIYWFRDSIEITDSNEKYRIRNHIMPAEMSTGDFESILSELVIFLSFYLSQYHYGWGELETRLVTFLLDYSLTRVFYKHWCIIS